MRRPKEFISKNFSENFTVTQIAEMVNLHPSYLERLFKKRKTAPLKDYLNYQRTLKAAYLLRSTNRSIEDVAFEVGVR